MQANTTQVGGEHYHAAPFQHWDLAAALKLGYFEGQITKYVTRHPRKNGAQDALKALHFTVKLAELSAAPGWHPAHLFPTQAMLGDYTESNRLSELDARIIRDVLTWQRRQDLEHVKTLLVELVMRQYGSRYLGDIAKCLGPEGFDAVCAAALAETRADVAEGQHLPVCEEEPTDGSAPDARYVNQD